ncbi:MAG: glycosyltransferase [Chloroflexota bacterium]
MATIAIYTSGTLGDHLPYLALGQALQQRGHQVRLVINQAMHVYARAAGLEAVAFSDIERGPEHTQQNAWAWNHWRQDQAPPVELPSLDELYGQYLAQTQEMLALCRDADLLLATSIRSHGLLLHLLTGLPWMTVSLNAVSFAAPPTPAEQRSRQNAGLSEYQTYRPLMAYVLERLGVERSLPEWRPGWSYARHVLLSSSPAFSQVELNQLQPYSSIDQLGFWYYDDPAWANWIPDEALRRFVERRPLALTFSSQPLEQPRQVLQLHVDAAGRLGMPLLVQRGWAGLSETDLPDSAQPGQVLFADYLPHDWLFARAAAAIQHGGIGSIARALRQGCPLLIEPFGNDQFYNARQVSRLGVGTSAHPFESSADELARLLERQVLSAPARRRAGQVGEQLRAERGADEACAMIERYLGRLEPGGAHPALYARFTPPLARRARASAQPERAFRLLLQQAGAAQGEQIVPEAQALALLAQPGLPRITGLLAARVSFARARQAAEAFLGQSYPNKFLAILDDTPDERLERWIAGLGAAPVALRRAAGLPPGDLYRWALEAGGADYLAVWDDHGLHHPQRLLSQLAGLQAAGTAAACLERLAAWRPAEQRLALSAPRPWLNTLLVERAPALAAAQRAGDAGSPGRQGGLAPGDPGRWLQPAVEPALLACLDYPQLYLHIEPPGRAPELLQGEDLHLSASRRFDGEAYRQMLAALQAGLGRDLAQAAAQVGAPDEASIPLILHQTWKDAEVPSELLAYQRSWLEHNPGWTYRLWTDQDLRALVADRYAWFLPIYDGYREAIQRADAGRYFVLHCYGGVYADLDFECLRSLDELLEGRQLVLGCEPETHLQQAVARSSGLARITCNAWIASQPGLPFWEHLFHRLVACHKLPGPLDATGPFFLTRAIDAWPEAQAITLLDAPVLYPVDKDTPWAGLPEDERRRLSQAAFAVHHWWGSWYNPPDGGEPVTGWARLVQRGVQLAVVELDLVESLRAASRMEAPPLISCMMVTRGRPGLAQRAAACFLQQTYPNRELVIIDDDPDPQLGEWAAALGDARVRHIRLPDEGLTLGELRNRAVEQAHGAFLAQWDDDDLSDPQRLELQMAALHALGADACLLQRHQMWWPEAQRLAFSPPRYWESSFICRRDLLPAYPAQRKGEDTLAIQLLLRKGRVALLDLPRLYTYVFHGCNTFEAGHWEEHWQQATARFEGPAYRRALARRERRLGIDLGRGPGAAGQPGLPPSVLILIPVKDVRADLPGLWQNLLQLTYPAARLSLAFLESDSRDGTAGWIEAHLNELRGRFQRAELHRQDYGFQIDGPRSAAELQRRRRAVMARSRNELLRRALRDEDWALWIDADLVSWPPDVIERLLAAGKDIVAPSCLAQGTRQAFDLNSFKLAPSAGRLDWSPYIIDGLLQPPRGFGRLYLTDLRRHDLVELDGVGGTMLLVKAELHRTGLLFPEEPYKNLIETEGLAALARDLGYTCWGLPNLEIWHPNR